MDQRFPVCLLQDCTIMRNGSIGIDSLSVTPCSSMCICIHAWTISRVCKRRKFKGNRRQAKSACEYDAAACIVPLGWQFRMRHGSSRKAGRNNSRRHRFNLAFICMSGCDLQIITGHRGGATGGCRYAPTQLKSYQNS